MTEIRVSEKNTKLGKIASFSLPSITACIAATEKCKEICYAEKLERIYKNTKKAYEINLAAISQKEFVETLVQKITKLTTKKKPIKTFRWQVSGDIINLQYLYNMETVMKKFPNVTFYAYTRNWTIDNWKSHLTQIKKLPNFTLIASLDDEHISKNLLPSSEWRVAYVGDKSLTEINALLNKTTIVCPHQSNSKHPLCDACKYCFNPKLSNTSNSVYFIKH